MLCRSRCIKFYLNKASSLAKKTEFFSFQDWVIGRGFKIQIEIYTIQSYTCRPQNTCAPSLALMRWGSLLLHSWPDGNELTWLCGHRRSGVFTWTGHVLPKRSLSRCHNMVGVWGVCDVGVSMVFCRHNTADNFPRVLSASPSGQRSPRRSKRLLPMYHRKDNAPATARLCCACFCNQLTRWLQMDFRSTMRTSSCRLHHQARIHLAVRQALGRNWELFLLFLP